jgi:mannose-6-phosphate isomerase-like protein (cupin superfamily)
MAVAESAPGYRGPLHVHLRSTETFMCLKGRFEIRWNDEGEDRTFLEPFDTITIPPGLYRGFSNAANETSLLLVIATGESDDDALIISRGETERLTQRFGAGVVEKLEAFTGFQFATAAND